MALTRTSTSYRPREWRRKVSLAARVRNGPGWSSGRILNLSSRGMLLQYGGPLVVGSTVELRKDEQAIVAKVVWRQGSRAGLSSPSPLPIADLLPVETAASLDASAFSDLAARNAYPRRHEQSRALGRRFEFIAIAAVAAMIALMVAAMASSVLFKPLAAAASVLGGG